MAFKGWEKIPIRTDSGSECEAIAPVIISASRSTDIPGFFAEWFMDRLRLGHLVWLNPFNRRLVHVSFQNTRVIVFWSKNPAPILGCLNEIDSRRIHYYFQFTLNDYEREGFEPGVPLLEKRMETFCRLSERLGKERVVWRFDPLILTRSLGVDELLEKIRRIGDLLHAFTETLVFSFVDIDIYKKVRNTLQKHQMDAREFDRADMIRFARGLSELNRSWNLNLASCGEAEDLAGYGIGHSRCIDDRLLIRLFHQDEGLMSFMGYRKGQPPGGDVRVYLKDKGQRKACGCFVSKDIGSYGTCGYGCIYCYANR